MDDLAAFVSARLDEDEAAARAATPGPWVVGRILGKDGEWHYGSHVAAMGEEKRMLLDMNTGYARSRHVETAEHVARHDPARALREVADGRSLLRQYEEFRAEAEAQRTAKGDVGPGVWSAFRVLSDTIRSRAAVWSDHPDYRPEWKP